MNTGSFALIGMGQQLSGICSTLHSTGYLLWDLCITSTEPKWDNWLSFNLRVLNAKLLKEYVHFSYKMHNSNENQLSNLGFVEEIIRQSNKK